MIVALDIDGTITRCLEFFALLSHDLVATGHEVLIITFRPDTHASLHAELEGMGIAYTELITNLQIGRHERLSDDEFVTWKAKVCKERKVDIFFEDMPDVAAAVEPPTVVMLPLGDQIRRFMASLDWGDDYERIQD